jgi:bleomycin hydrolase
MGADQSKLVEPTMHEKAVLERLRTLQIQDDYVQVTSDSEKTPLGPLVRDAEGLPVPVLQSWQTDVLKDPKNK